MPAPLSSRVSRQPRSGISRATLRRLCPVYGQQSYARWAGYADRIRATSRSHPGAQQEKPRRHRMRDATTSPAISPRVETRPIAPLPTPNLTSAPLHPHPPPMDPTGSPIQNGDGLSQQLFEDGRRKADSRTPNQDSPSRQLLFEFSRMLIDSDRKFHNELDRAAAEQEKKHLEALAAAAAEHERVRQSAERVAEKFRLEVERERKRREEYEHRELERIRQENARIEAERRQRQIDEVKRKEEEQRRAAEEARALEEAQERLRKQKAQEEADAAKRKAEQEERERREKEELAAAAAAAEKARAEQALKAQQPTPAPTQINGAAPVASQAASEVVTDSPLVSSRAVRDAVHKEYLDIHQRLKVFRKNFQNEVKSNPALKKTAGDLRREIRMKLGQLTLNPRQNRDQVSSLGELYLESE